MAVISAVLSDGVRKIDYDAAARTATVYYATGDIEYFQGVAWGDYSTVAVSSTPAVTVSATLSKYRSFKGGR